MSRMPCQRPLLRKRSSTNFAFERLLASMRAKMLCQMMRTRTRFIARATHERSDEHVSSRMSCQTALLIKRSIALSAFERLLASMNTIVSCQSTSSRKIFIADFTDMSSSWSCALRWPRSLLLGTAKQIVVLISSSSRTRSRSKLSTLSVNICNVLSPKFNRCFLTFLTVES